MVLAPWRPEMVNPTASGFHTKARSFSKPDYIRLWSTEITTSVWDQPKATKITWITMLLMADWTGLISYTEDEIAQIAHVSVEECAEAIIFLSSPDQNGENKEYDGRRIINTDNGWKILNFHRYAGEERKKLSSGQKAYREFLKTKFWKSLSRQCLIRDNFRCTRCKSKKKLQAHHIIYRKSWFDTLLEDLETLCKRCHKTQHNSHKCIEYRAS